VSVGLAATAAWFSGARGGWGALQVLSSGVGVLATAGTVATFNRLTSGIDDFGSDFGSLALSFALIEAPLSLLSVPLLLLAWPACGSANYPSDPVCLSCGRALAPGARSASLSPTPPPSRPAGSDRHGAVPGTAALLVGGLSLLLGHYWVPGLLLGPVAWVLGNKALAAMRPGEGSPAARGQAQVGRICGMISSALLALMVAVIAPLLGLAFLLGGGRGGAPTVP